MSGSWARTHRRHALVQAVLSAARERGSGDLSNWESQISDEFGDVERFLLDLQWRWNTAFECHLDALLESPPEDPHGAVAQLWRELSNLHPGLRRVLDHHRDSPALVTQSVSRRRGFARYPHEPVLSSQRCAN